MTEVFFVRHAQSDLTNHDEESRALSPKGLADRRLVTAFFAERSLDAVFSSPYRRTVETVEPLARERGLAIRLDSDFRERDAGGWLEDFDAFARAQWADFSYRLPGGESLAEAQTRNLRALSRVLAEYPGGSVVIGSHETALCTVIHAFDPSFGYPDFAAMQGLMPWIVQFRFHGAACRHIQTFDLFAE